MPEDDDGSPLGPLCPACGGELSREAIAPDGKILVLFVCHECGPAYGITPFEA